MMLFDLLAVNLECWCFYYAVFAALGLQMLLMSESVASVGNH